MEHSLALFLVNLAAAEKLWAWEMKNFGFVTQPTKDLRRISIENLQRFQLRGFDNG